jgi:hypothetical protein
MRIMHVCIFESFLLFPSDTAARKPNLASVTSATGKDSFNCFILRPARVNYFSMFVPRQQLYLVTFSALCDYIDIYTDVKHHILDRCAVVH